MQPDIRDMLKNDLQRSATRKQSNRESFPHVAELVDSLKPYFGPVKVLWCKEGDKEMGKRKDFDA